MPLQKIAVRSGVNQQQTQTLNSTSWWASNLIRFRDGTVEKIGGWSKLFTTRLAGLARALWGYEDLQGANDLLIGTDGGAQLYSGGTLYDFDLLNADDNVAGSALSTAASPLYSVDYVNGTFFAASNAVGGVAYKSADGSTWTLVTLPNDTFGNPFRPVQFAYGGGVYVAVSAVSRGALTSTDGVTWTLQPVGGVAAPMVGTSVAYGNGTFVVVTNGQNVYTSPDGITWTVRTAVHPYGWFSVAYGASVFVAVTSYSSGGSVYCMTSPDGVTWTGRSGLPASTGVLGWGRVRFLNSLFLVTNYNSNTSCRTSTDGITWTNRTLPANAGWYDQTYGNSLYVLVGNSSAVSNPCILTSPDLTTWTRRTSPNESNQWTGVASNGTNKFIAVCDLTSIGAPYMASSTNGTTWGTQSYGNTTTLTITDNNYSPAVGDSVTLPVRVAIGSVVLTPATYPVTTTNPSGHSYTITLSTAVSTGSTAVPPLFTIQQSQIGSSIMTVTLAGHGYTTPGQLFPVDILTTIENNSFDLAAQNYSITQVLDTSTFLIDTGHISTAVNVDASYPDGNYEGQDNATGTVPIWYNTANFPSNPSNWYLDNLGQNGMIVYTDSPLFVWTPPVDAKNVASNVTTASQINAGMLVAMPQAQVITWGSQPVIGSGAADPLLIRFSDAGSYDVWTATTTNQAGSYRLSKGSLIVGGVQMALTTLIWTDTDVWTMFYSGPPFVYSFSILASGCGLISPKARAIIGSTCYWMSQKQFWQYTAGGAATPIYCPVWDVIFNDLDQDNLNKINAGANSAFDEIMFFYPSMSGGTGEVDKYIKITKGPDGSLLWDYGTLGRTTWMDQSVFGNAMGGDLDSYIQQHEIGYDADGSAMEGVFIESGYAELNDGDDMMLVTEVIPDLKWFGDTPGAIYLTLKSMKYPQGPFVKKGPFGMDMNNRHIRPRVRARGIALRWDWIARLGYNGRLGAVSVRSQASGKRP